MENIKEEYIKKKRGLVFVFDPHNLHQFIWYYMAYAKDYSWTAFCMPNAFKKEYMSEYCVKSDIFDEVLRTDDISYEAQSLRKKIIFFIQIVFAFLIGKKKQKCKQIIRQYVEPDDYDRIVVITEGGIVSGACVALSDEKDIVILDDGYREYKEKRRWRNFFDKKQSYRVIALLLSCMGYSSPRAIYPFAPLLNCTKFLIHPESKLADTSLYKKVYKMYDNTFFSSQKCSGIYEKIYPELDHDRIREAEAVVLLPFFNDITSKVDIYNSKMYDYISKKYSNIVVKAHPSDKYEYHFPDSVRVYEIDRHLPFEFLISYLDGKDVLCFYPSSSILVLPESRVVWIVFNGIYFGNDNDIFKCNFEENKRFFSDIVNNYKIEYLD